MERKIGEIFEYEGEWYQCVESPISICIDCDFIEYCQSYDGECSSTMREDAKSICFKKLEKVGEPYPLYGHIVQRYAGVKFPVALTEKRFINCNEINNTVDIEVKQQNKEDMEANGKTITLPDGWEFDHLDERGNIVLKEKKKELPKTWEECCGVLNIKLSNVLDDGIHYRYAVPDNLRKPILALCQLLVCRNAWWKQLGWKPDWNNYHPSKHCIKTIRNEIEKYSSDMWNCILAFPTEDIRDQFLETFKDLIEEAKELL